MRKKFLIILFTMALGACKKSNTSGSIPQPEKVNLIYPASNSVCTEGNILSATHSSIHFNWAVSKNTESYDITITNLKSGETITQSSLKPEADVKVLRSTPHAWFVTSKSSKSSVSTKSDEWRFYNSGPGEESFAPFPAVIVSPIKDQSITAINGKIALDWEGADVDDDITTYDVYLGTTSFPAHLKNVIESKLIDVQVSANTDYFWKVITKDARGNSSDSGVFTFRSN